MTFCPAPKPEKKKKNKRAKPICENPSCSRVSRIKYRGCFTYRLCPQCYLEWYFEFCNWIKKENGFKCKVCKARGVLEIHHDPKRSQGGKHTKEDCTTLCIECHEKEHGQ